MASCEGNSTRKGKTDANEERNPWSFRSVASILRWEGEGVAIPFQVTDHDLTNVKKKWCIAAQAFKYLGFRVWSNLQFRITPSAVSRASVPYS